MTRFARAKGSKASNERLPEEATTWSEMKQQLVEKNKELEVKKKQKEAHETRNANYKAFLEEKEKDNIANTNWAEFPDASTVKKNKKNKNKNTESDTVKNTSSKGIQKAVTEEMNDSDEPPEEESSKKDIIEPVVKTKKVKTKKLLKRTLDEDKNDNSNADKSNKTAKKRKIKENGDNVMKKIKTDANKASKVQKKKIVKENLTEKDLKKIEKKKMKRLKQVEKKNRMKALLKEQKAKETQENGETKVNEPQTEEQSQTEPPSKPFNNNADSKGPSNKFTDKKKGKIKDKGEHPRKKPLLPHKMFINGKELEVEYVEGFPVKKEDAIRLKKLRREMISKGLPRSEINIALKLERRKAEKAFTREKKKVCFHCRKSGHNLSECPNFDKTEVAQTNASGICFKCGSTEHTHFECKVVRGQEFKFATCFICQEQGHIARQCPDNARGLYPKGGACNVCGDVTHLKKDCPKYQVQQQKQEESLRLETLGASNPDMLEDKADDRRISNNKRHNKIIKF